MDKETYYDVVIIGNTIAAFSLASQLDKEQVLEFCGLKPKKKPIWGIVIRIYTQDLI